MHKIILIGVSILMPLTALGEANVKTDESSQTFLLNAPGTLSGIVDKEEPIIENSSSRPASTIQRPLRYKPGRYKKGGESYKFPQWGQVKGRHNPWSEQESNRRLPPALPPASPNYSNPWDLGGKLPPQTGPYTYPASPYPYNPTMNQAYGPYGNAQNLYPDFPNNIYRDTNPATTMPFFNGTMPGMGGDNSSFPFSPFGMF